MKKVILAISVLVGILSIANPAHSVTNGEEVIETPYLGEPDPEIQIGTPAMLCKQDHGMWRVFGNLVFALEGCTAFDQDITGRDTTVLFLESYGNPRGRCDDIGGEYEFIGNPLYFNLRICWDTDF